MLSLPQFNTQDSPEFYKTLRKRVNQYFKENNISKYGNSAMKIKTVVLIAMYFVPLMMFYFGLVSNIWIIAGLWLVMGFGMAGVGMGIMHDANHGAYSKNKTVNKYLGKLLALAGGSDVNWKIQHNVLHHSFTNVHEIDEDIDTGGIMRFSPNQPRKKIHRFQSIYAWFFYGLLTLNWSLVKDFFQLSEYNKKQLLKTQNISYAKALLEIIFTKAFYFTLTLVLPMILLPIPWWQTVILFVLMHFVAGLVLSLIFQSAHVLQDTTFHLPKDNGSLENSWAIIQLSSTANFAPKSRILSWFIGGLNYQIEHHLFPTICHVHYKKISKIVKQTAQEFQLPYHEYPTFAHALINHFRFLHQLGKA